MTIPKDVRDDLGLEAGTKLDFVKVGPKEYRLRPKNLRVEDLFGILRYQSPVARDALEQLIEDGESVGTAIEQARQGADFADALIDATSLRYGVSETVTFDRSAAQRFDWKLLG